MNGTPARVERVAQSLAYGVFGFARLLYFDEDCWKLIRRMAQGEIGASLAGLIFGPNRGSVVDIPA